VIAALYITAGAAVLWALKLRPARHRCPHCRQAFSDPTRISQHIRNAHR